ncbi:AAA family ATPase [Streptomyces arboris]|uniref:AAA family ATPase n=1 Tax=Streptomyces arboris TaxID=2600619 RepID=UPI003C2EABA1
MTQAVNSHYLQLQDATLQSTAATRLTGGYLQDIADVGGILCVSGTAGLGKTVAVGTNLNDLAPSSHRRLPTRPGLSLRDYRQVLATTFGIPPTPENLAGLTLESHIQQAVQAQRQVLFIDEAHTLSNAIYASLATLWDACRGHLALAFVGNEHCPRRIRHAAPLASRIDYWQPYKPLTHAQVIEIIPKFHPQWAHVSESDLIWSDDAACRGNFRNWARFTRKLCLKNEQRGNPPGTFTQELAREALQEFSPSEIWTGEDNQSW